MGFFNKAKWVLTKQSDPLITPNTAFTLPVYIIDTLGLQHATAVVATIVKVSGRNKVALPTAVTETSLGNGEFTLSATIASTDWTGAESLSLSLVIDGLDTLTVPLVAVS
jgi:hypothetical protein